jgi:hypothetical protein
VAVPIPTTIYDPPKFRVLTAQSFGGTAGDCTKSTASWTTLSQPDPTTWSGGYELLRITRRAFPEIGEASFRFVYGEIPGTTDSPDILLYNEVRLQLYDTINSEWVTVFWGQVVAQERQDMPGASDFRGVTVYHCVDGFARTQKWILNYSGYDSGSTQVLGPARGHPGYNYMMDSDGPLLGNMSPSKTYSVDGIAVPCHTWQGAFAVNASHPDGSGNTNPALQVNNKWSELAMVNHACLAVKPVGEPAFTLAYNEDHALLVYSPQPVYDNESVFSVVTRITNRRRGQGTVWVDWTDNLDGSLHVFLGFCPPVYDDLSYTIPGTMTSVLIEGAESAGTVYQWNGDEVLDLEGDPRNIDAMFAYSEAALNVYDEIDTMGERIEVAATLCMYDGAEDNMTDVYDDMSYALSPRWSPTDVYTFARLPQWQRTQPYWDFIFQTAGLPRDWAGFAGNGINTDKQRVDFRTDAAGEIIAPHVSDYTDTMANMVELLPYLPFYEGYDYSKSVPQKTDSSQQFGLPQRRQLAVYIRPSGWSQALYVGYDEDRWFLPGGGLPQVVTNEKVYPQSLGDYFSPSVTVQPDGIIFKSANAQNAGIRVISDPVFDATLDANYQINADLPVTRVAFTIGLRMPWRMQFTSYGDDFYGSSWTTARKRKVIYIENAHLWLAAANCIWDLSQTDVDISGGAQGYAARRNALGSSDYAPAVLRDDRAIVIRYHTLAAEWYLNPRSRLCFGMQYCGLLPFTWGSYSQSTGMHPKLGQFVQTANESGGGIEVETVVTQVDYDHQNMTTRWETDYYELEMR